MAERLVVPRLRIRRDWFKGLAADPVDHSNPDIGDVDPKAKLEVGRSSSCSPTGYRVQGLGHHFCPMVGD